MSQKTFSLLHLANCCCHIFFCSKKEFFISFGTFLGNVSKSDQPVDVERKRRRRWNKEPGLWCVELFLPLHWHTEKGYYDSAPERLATLTRDRRFVTLTYKRGESEFDTDWNEKTPRSFKAKKG